MQFHLDGFRIGDPSVSEPVPGLPSPGSSDALPDELDVLIVGSGPAGLTLAAQLAAFPGITTRIVEQRSGRLTLGQADGIACRTMEMFEAFGFSERVLKEAYWVNETSFWKPHESRPDIIVRSGRIQDTEDGLSEFPHVILNQARVHDFFLDVMRNAPTRLEPSYGRRVLGLSLPAPRDDGCSHGADLRDEFVTVRLERLDAPHAGAIETVRARYLVGCDGARSTVRRALDLPLVGESANQAWGVMDVLAVSDFPDIRLKAAIHSASEGSLLVIPREGGYLVRLYIELDKLNADERVADRKITVDRLIAAAQRILHPYSLDVKGVAWWSVYEIGQRLCDRFDDVPEAETASRDPRVFVAGDACHTHSPKAGQGMNVSMQDGFNLGWKLASVLLGRSSPRILRTYSAERRAIAQELIDFDREFARMFSASPKRRDSADGEGIDPAEFQSYFRKQGRFTAGTATRYAPSIVSAEPCHQHLATGFTVGMRFHSAPVIRFADARPMSLGHALTADGRWRVFLFADAGSEMERRSRLAEACAFLGSSSRSPIRRYTPPGADIDSVVDLRAVFQQARGELESAELPAILRPAKGRYGLVDHEKVFCPDFKVGDIFAMRGVSRTGCVVIVRPDQHVANVLPLDAYDEIASFFDRFMLPCRRSPSAGGAPGTSSAPPQDIRPAGRSAIAAELIDR